MASPELYPFHSHVLDDHHTFRLLTCTFQDQVVPLGLLDRQHFHELAVDVDDHRQLRLAHLALELLEIVVQGSPDHLLLDFVVNPFHETFYVYSPAGPRAFAGVEEVVLLGLGLLQANLTLPLVLLIPFGGVELHHLTTRIHPFPVHQRCNVQSPVEEDLTHIELHPPDLDGLAGL